MTAEGDCATLIPGCPDPSRPAECLEAGMAAGASDWHFRSGEPCYVRVAGSLVRWEQDPIGEETITAFVAELLGKQGPIPDGTDASFEWKGEVFRLHTYRASGGLCAALRHIPGRIRDLESLGAPAAFKRSALSARRGLILVTGPAGAGKSTTLAAAIDHLNRRSAGVILTFEDPIEHRHANRRGLVRQMEFGRDFTDFGAALRGALRSDPDVLMVGEMRDADTISAALTAAETGHLVLGTLHCATAKDAVSRVVDSFPASRAAEARAQLSKSLVAVLAQQRLRTPAGRRTAAFELLLATPAVRHLICQPGAEASLDNEIALGRSHGMVAMDQAIEDLWKRGVIDPAEALRAAVRPEPLEARIEEAAR